MKLLARCGNLFLFIPIVVISFGSCRNYVPAQQLVFGSLTSAPVFVLPACDQANGIERVYFKRGNNGVEDVVEVTVVFSDEDHPFFLFDAVYDLFRCFRYHRKKDIETFYMYLSSKNQQIIKIDFGDAYSGLQKFSKGIVKHFHQSISGNLLEMQNGRPVVYINTWNHLFSESDTNPGRPKIKYAEYSCFAGSRLDAEPKRKSRKGYRLSA